jgi:hypothetical protein
MEAGFCAGLVPFPDPERADMLESQTMNRVRREASQDLSSTRPRFPMFTAAGVLGLLLLIGASWLWTRPTETAKPSIAEAEPDALPQAAEQASTPAVSRPTAVARARVEAARSRSASDPVAAGAGSALSEQLIGQLSQLQIADGKLTAEQGAQIQNNLRQLVAQGAASLPAIRAYLDQNQDLPFGADGSKLAGVPSVRAGLIDALRQIGGPESLALSHQILQTSADPLEISLLTRNLEEAAPGQYRQEALDSARQSLTLARQGKLGDRDLGPVFQVLQTYGDANTAAELVKLAPQWNYYATMALAGLPAGQGVASLVEVAHQPPSAETGQYNKLPYQMLAQLSSQYPDASSALLDMARQNQIPDTAWRAVAAGLGGNQYQFSRQLPQNTFPAGATIEAGSSRAGGPSEAFYSLPLGTDASAADLRVSVIDQLLSAAAGNQAALDALNQARAKLSGTTASK